MQLLYSVLLMATALAQDDPPILMEERAYTEERWGTLITGRTQVMIWNVDGETRIPDTSASVDEMFIALDVGNGFRFSYLVSDGISVGGDLGWGVVFGAFGGTSGIPFGAGIDAAPMIGFGTDGTHPDQSPVGLVLAAGARLDVQLLSGVGFGDTPIAVMPRPFGSAELLVDVTPFLVGLRAEYVLPGKVRSESFDAVTEVTVGRFGGGVVFNLPF